MGVKDLWSILSPVSERKSLWELQDKTIAIDLSCWVCDSQNVMTNASQPRMYLRNLFFRTNCLLLLGAHPIFVLEGKAPELKYDIMDKRKLVRNKEFRSTQKDTESKGKRSRLNSLLCKCQQLLTIMGLTCVKSMGEAEAFCALLNRFKHVDGCITQDGDCFLYGAQTVYRNFTISSSGGSSGSNSGFSIDVYKMSVIEDRLSLDQSALIAISLLCGCDYNEKGVTGVGKETVLKFLHGVRGEDVLNRLKSWRTDSYFEKLEEKRTLVSRGVLCEVCGHNGRKIKHTKNGCELCGKFQGCEKNVDFPLSDPAIVAELNIRKRALLDPEFPSQMVIDEFLHQQFPVDGFTLDKTWNKPDLESFVLFAVKLLGWTEFYAFEKCMPIVTRWQLVQLQKDNNAHPGLKFPFSPHHIVKKRVTRGVESYEIQWEADNIKMPVHHNISLVTVEPQNLVDKAYPKIVESYLITKNAKTKRVARKKIQTLNSDHNTQIVVNAKENNFRNSTRKQTRIDRFFNSPVIVQKKTRVLKDKLNIINTDIESKVASGTSQKKQTELSSVKMISDYFAKMNLKPKAPSFQESVSAAEMSECNNSVLSHTCYHQKEKTILEDLGNFEKSLCLDVCEICDKDDPIDDKDLSVIIDSIISRKIPAEAKNNLLKKNQVTIGESVASCENVSFDEFDYLEDKCIPLIDRLRAKQ